MELAETWEPKRGFVWMKRWLETHRMRKAARDAMKEAAQVKQPTIRNYLSNISSFRSPGTHPENLMRLLTFSPSYDLVRHCYILWN
jgi:hypothetical protein